jgi:hypothetical protein
MEPSRRPQLEQHLQQLKTELETGQKMLAELEQRRLNLEQTILRIAGAIQVLKELLAADPGTSAGVEPPDGSRQAAPARTMGRFRGRQTASINGRWLQTCDLVPRQGRFGGLAFPKAIS